MLRSPGMITFRVSNVEQAKRWYERILKQKPLYDSPLLVTFDLGASVLGLVPGARVASEEGCVAYFIVDDILATHRHLLEEGATSHSEVTLVLLNLRTARVRDPFGNVLGLMSTTPLCVTLKDIPSETALTVAFCRALSAHDDQLPALGPDNLAETFLEKEGHRAFLDPDARRAIVKSIVTYGYFVGRTAFLDRVFEEALDASTAQIVLLGAGYDTRAQRFSRRLGGTRVFELDRELTQRRKRERLLARGEREPSGLTYVPIDFEHQDIAQTLMKAGYDRRKQTLFLWEGVTYYLTPEAVDSTLSFIRTDAGPGSTVAFDYLLETEGSRSRYGAEEVWEAWRTSYTAEPIRSYIPEGTLETFLRARGFALLEHLDAGQLEQRYLTRTDGSLAARSVEVFGLALAKRT